MSGGRKENRSRNPLLDFVGHELGKPFVAVSTERKIFSVLNLQRRLQAFALLAADAF